MSSPFLIKYDWLSFRITSFDYYKIDQNGFILKRTGQSKVYKNIYEVIIDETTIATITTDAPLVIMPIGHAIIKFDNKYLWLANNLNNKVKKICTLLKSNFHSYTRIDICKDFYYFDNNYSPQDFIQDFIHEKILKKNATKVQANFKHCSSTNTTNNNFKHHNIYNGLKFGNNTSDITYKLYNKSLEMFEKINKPYIQNQWKKHLDYIPFKSNDVWRLEFTLNHTNNKFILLDKELTMKNFDFIQEKYLPELFEICFNHYFQFVINNPNKKRKDRMLKLHLFQNNMLKTEKIIFEKFVPQNSNRTNKMLIKLLDNHITEANNDYEMKQILSTETAHKLLSKLIEKYSLEDWAEMKAIHHQKTNLKEELTYKNEEKFNAIQNDLKIFFT